ncbi:MAG: YfiH family protein [Candidatus Aldehydirespiratoraceae bacterium]
MIEQLLPAGPLFRVRVRCSERTDGNFHVGTPAAELGARRVTFAPGAWTWLCQVHGATVVAVEKPGDGAGLNGDASVTNIPGAVLAAQTADCAPVVLVGDGVLAVAHAGWRGIVEGVLPAAVQAVQDRSAGPVRALLGPVIRPASYAFSERDLAEVQAVAGPCVRGVTRDGEPALDMAAAVKSVLEEAGVVELIDLGLDTADAAFYSHRTRHDPERQVTVAWLERTDD